MDKELVREFWRLMEDKDVGEFVGMSDEGVNGRRCRSAGPWAMIE